MSNPSQPGAGGLGHPGGVAAKPGVFPPPKPQPQQGGYTPNRPGDNSKLPAGEFRTQGQGGPK